MERRPPLFAGAIVLIALLAPFVAEAQIKAAGGLSLGLNASVGGQADVTLSDIAKGLPVQARFGVGYWVLDPGDPVAARAIFINNNTNGTPEKSGHRWDLRMDALHQFGGGALHGWWLAVGPRYSMFHADFSYVDGNEIFYVSTHQFGLGGALEGRWPTGPETDLTASFGLDWFADATFSGHDTSYSPDGSSVNQKEQFTYKDADKAVHQPRLAPRVMVGLQHRFGR